MAVANKTNAAPKGTTRTTLHGGAFSRRIGNLWIEVENFSTPLPETSWTSKIFSAGDSFFGGQRKKESRAKIFQGVRIQTTEFCLKR